MRLDDDRCYRALRARDARFDGRFFVGVGTTGIYCRPICPARTARREHVRFFGSAAAAEEAGFRPCRRCRPETAPGSPAWTGPSVMVERALRLIDQGVLDEAGVDSLAARLGVGDHHLRRLFLEHVGATPTTVARTRRAHFARRLIDETRLPITEVAFASGFGSLRQFNDVMKATFGAAPRSLRRGARPRDEEGPALALNLPVRPPADLSSVLEFLGPRATKGVEELDGRTYRRLMRLGDRPVTVELELPRGAEAVTLRLSGVAGPGLTGLVARARRLLDHDADGAAIRAHLAHDRGLEPLLPRAGSLRMPGTLEPWEIAVKAVVGQQVSVAAARTFVGRIVERHGKRVAHAGPLTHLFPSPQELAEADLGSIGLTAARAETLRTLAHAVADGKVSLEAGALPEATREGLLALPGIGPWTVEYVALRALGDPDAFPASDLGLRRALSPGGGPSTAAEVMRRAESWRPWRGYAVFALWHSLAPRGEGREGSRR